MAARVKEKVVPVQAFVHSQFVRKDAKNGEVLKDESSDKMELVSVQKFVTEPAKVSVDYGLTLSLGNYETARVGVAVTVPCYFEELDHAYRWASKWVETRLNAEQESIRKMLRERTEDDFE